MLSLVFSCLLQSTPLFIGNLPTAPLRNALKTAQTVKPTDSHLKTKEKINTYLQEKWLRKPGTERNTLAAPAILDQKQTKNFQNTFYKLEMIGAHNQKKILSPTVVVILGGNYPGMEERILFAKKIVQSLKKIPTVILLTGDRILEKTRQDDIKPLDNGAPKTCKTEEDAGNYLMGKHCDFPMTLVNAPKQPKTKRATTADNAKALQGWLLKNNIKGTIVLISTEPHGPYQLGSIEKNCHVKDTCFFVQSVPFLQPFDGKMIAVCMDALARMVHTEVTP